MINKEYLKIGVYIRVSTEEQAKNPEGSIKSQKERIRQAVSLKNQMDSFGEIVDFYVDAGKSGKDTNRSELQRLLKDIDKGEVTLVAVSELSRISRDIRDFSQIWNLMKDKGCGFYSLRENFDSTTAAGEMVLYSIANIAQFERRQVSERVAANMNSRASRGLYNGGPVPFGYSIDKVNKGRLKVIPTQAETVRVAFKAFLEEGTLAATAKWLNSHSYTLDREMEGGGRFRGKYFTVESLYRILKRKAYIARRNYKELGEVKETTAAWEPIIDEGTFYKVGKLLKENRSRKKPKGKNKFPYLLSGLVSCGHCKDNLCGKTANGKGGKFGYYEHSWATKRQSVLVKKVFECDNYKRIGSKKLEPLVLEKISELLRSEDLQRKLFDKVRALAEDNPHQTEAKRLTEKVQGFERQLKVLVSRLAELPEEVSPTLIFNHMKLIESEKKEVEVALSLAKQKAPTDTNEIAELSDFKSFAARTLSIFNDEVDHIAKAKAIRALIKKIEVRKESVEIFYYVGKDKLKIKKEGGLPKLGDSPSFLKRKLCSNTLTNGGGQEIRTLE